MVISEGRSLPFDVALIVSTQIDVKRVEQRLRDLHEPRIALLVRDPLHRIERVLDLADFAHSALPRIYLISNGCHAPGAHAVQLPFAMRGKARSLDADGIPFGISVHSLAEVRDAESARASWLIFSPIFPTPSKPGQTGVGLSGLREVCEMTTL